MADGDEARPEPPPARGGDARARLRVGVASVVVDVPVGTTLSGFAARTSGSSGVHDPCTVRALAVGETCWVAVDVCALHEDTCAEIEAASGMGPGHAAVTATHTHSGPACTPGRLAGDDAAIRRGVVAAAVSAAAAARESREPMTLRHSATRAVGVAVNRRDPSQAIDPPIDLVSFERADGSVRAWLVSYPCHPVVLSADNLLVSGDYVHFLRDELELSAPGSVALFLPGTAGDVNNGHPAEASFGDAPQAGRTFTEAERIGRHLARSALASTRRIVAPDAAVAEPDAAVAEAAAVAAVAAVAEPAYGPVIGWSASARRLRLRLRTLDAVAPGILASRWEERARAAGRGEAALLRAWVEWAGQREEDEPMTWEARVTSMRWGALTLIGLPGEPFHSCAEIVHDAVRSGRHAQGHPPGPIIVTGYTSGCPGYLPEASAYAKGGYEVVDAHRYYGMPAPFAQGSVEALQAVAVQLALGR